MHNVLRPFRREVPVLQPEILWAERVLARIRHRTAGPFGYAGGCPVALLLMVTLALVTLDNPGQW